MAQLFSNWQRDSRYLPERLQYAYLLDAGLGTIIMPDSYSENRLQWLADEIANDSRFARATLKTVYTALTGHDVLSPPIDDNANALAAYNAQRELFSQIEQQLIDSDYNLKTLVAALVVTPYFRANGLTDFADAALYSTSSTAHMLTPEALHRKNISTLGIPWTQGNNNLLLSPTFYRDIYGGINSVDVNVRNYDPNGLVVAT